MRINNTSNVGGVARGGKTRKSGETQGKFQPGQTSQASSGARTQVTQSIRGVDALLAIQEVSLAGGGKKKRAIRRGNSMLDILEEIRTDLLAGGLSGQKLQRLLQLVREQSQFTGDDGLDRLLEDIELRAMVELAKRGLGD